MPSLVAFDFDHTIADDNSDLVVRKLLPPHAVSSKIEALHKSEGWTCYMQEIFNLLHQFKINETVIRNAVCRIPPVPGILDLIRNLHAGGWEVIVISDANSYFIQVWLQHHKVDEQISRVFTNPGKFVRGRLQIHKYHTQDWCKLSTKNLCKGHILEEYISQRKSEGVTFEKLAYIGDGKNDLCPSIKLGPSDFVFPRIGYKLVQLLEKSRERGVVAQIIPWHHGAEVYRVLLP